MTIQTTLLVIGAAFALGIGLLPRRVLPHLKRYLRAAHGDVALDDAALVFLLRFLGCGVGGILVCVAILILAETL